MSERKKEKQSVEQIKLEPGDVLTFGSVNLLLSLAITQREVNKYKVKWDKLSSIDNLRFLRKHQKLWKRVEISTTNETIKLLLQLNKSSQKIIKIGYVAMQKIIYKNTQRKFQEFVRAVTNNNGIFLTSCAACNCPIDIKLKLIYNNKEKIFTLVGSSSSTDDKEKKDKTNNETKNGSNTKNENDKKDNDNEEKTENKKDNNENTKNENDDDKNKDDEENPFVNINEEMVKLSDYNFIYFNLKDYVSGDLNCIKLKYLAQYFENIKITTNSKIVLNMGEEQITKNEELNEILSLTDVYIFYDQNKLYGTFKSFKEKEDKVANEEEYFRHYYDAKLRHKEKENNKKREEKLSQKFREFLELQEREKDSRSISRKNTIFTNNLNLKNIASIKETPEKNTDTNIDKNNNINPTTLNKIYLTEGSYNNTNNLEKINIMTNKIQENEKNNISNNIENNIQKEKRKNTIHQTNRTHSKNNKTKPNFHTISPINPPSLEPTRILEKNEMFTYFKTNICDKDPIKKFQYKTAIVMDEFNKIFIVKFNKNEEIPTVLDFDIKLYPKINLRNINTVNEYKKFVKSKFNEYIIIFIGNILSFMFSQGKDGCEEKNLFMGYLFATNALKKIVELERCKIPLPTDKSFYYPSINKNELDKLIAEANLRKKESNFVLDFARKTGSNDFKQYNPLLDKNLFSFFRFENNLNILRQNGFLGKNGELLYDTFYKETPRLSQNNKKNIKINDKDLIKSIKEVKRKNNFIMREDECFVKYKNPTTGNTKLSKFIVGYNKKEPAYSMYNPGAKNVILPPIGRQKIIDLTKKGIDSDGGDENDEDEDEENRESDDKEEGSDSGSGSGSGSGES